MREMRAELAKTRRRKIGLSIICLMSLQFVWCFWIFTRAKGMELTQEYYYGFMEFGVMNSIFFPVVLAVAASRIWDTEHKGGTWKLLETLETKDAIYRCKFLMGAIYCLAITILQMIFLIVLAWRFHFEQKLPMNHMVWFCVSGFAVSLAVYLIQQILSMYYENQIIPLAAGLLGAFGGLFSNFLPSTIQRMVVWGYYGVLRSINMDWDKETRITTLYERPMDYGFLVFVFLLAAALYWGGKRLFLRKEF